MDLPASQEGDGDFYTMDDLADEIDDADVEDGEEDEFGGEQYDNSQLTFSQHEGSVFVVDIDKNNKYVISGGEDDKAYVWELQSGQVVLEIKCKDSVEYASFSNDSSMVAVGDLSGLIKIYYIFTKNEIWSTETADLQWMEWHPQAPVIMAGTQDGSAWLWKIPSGEFKIFPSPGSPCTCGKILPDGKTAALGYEGGAMKIVDLKTQETLHSITREGHKNTVHYLTCSEDGLSLISGAVDGITLLTNIPSGKVFAIYSQKEKHQEDVNYSIEGVGYSDSLSYIAVASLDTNMYIWDMKSGNLRSKCKHPEGVTRLLWDNRGLNIFTGCTDGICRQWNARTGELINTFIGHNDQILDLSLSKDDQIFLSASSDGTVRAYDVAALN